MASEVARGRFETGKGSRDILRSDKINWPWRSNAAVVCIGVIGSVWVLWGGRDVRVFLFGFSFLLFMCVCM